MDKNLISVVIPTYNREATIKATLESILQQTYRNLEILVVDDASNDNTGKVIRSINDPRIYYFKNKKQMGANISRNIGIEHAKGKLIAFCDSADTWAAEKLEKQLQIMQETSAEIIFCAEEVTDKKNTYIIPFATQKAMVLQDRLLELLSSENCIDTSTLLVEKKCFDEVGIFNLELPRLQEYEWMIRAAQKFRVAYLDEVLVSAFIRGDSISSDMTKLLRAVPIIYREHYGFLKSFRKQTDFLLSPVRKLSQSHAPFEEYEKYFNLLEKTVGNIQVIDWKQLYQLALRLFVEKDYVRNYIVQNKLAGKTLSNLLEKNISFCIFGAGEASRKLCSWLKKHGYIQLVKSIIVTSLKDNMENAYSIPMLEIRKCDQKIRNLPIVLAVSENIVYDIIFEMQQHGHQNIVCLAQEDTDMLEGRN